jgi:hypothetical protein
MLQVAVLSAILLAQVNSAVLTGVVRDGQTGLPVPGALVALPDLARSALADAQGRYRFNDVPAGPQHVSVHSLGYEMRMLHALVPSSGLLEINIALHALPISLRPVEVRPRVTIGSSAEASPSALLRSISSAAIRNDPLHTEPDVFLSLAGRGVVLLPESAKGVHILGGAADQTAFLLDGVPVINPYHAAGVFSAWNPDALAGLQVSASAPLPQLPDVLSGAIVGVTRRPDDSFSAQGGVSTSQARVTVDGPLAGMGARYLLSARSGFPDLVAPHSEASYLRGETSDALGKIELAMLGGQLQLLGYESENELDAAAAANAARTSRRNTFEWESSSLGLDWRGALGSNAMQILLWSAQGSAEANWLGAGSNTLHSARNDIGLVATIERGAAQLGARMQRLRTSYAVLGDSEISSDWKDAAVPTGTVFLRYVRAGTHGARVEASTALTAAAREYHFSPRLYVAQRLPHNLTLSASLARTQQFAQSLRNAESVAGHIFPVDVFLAAGVYGVPVATSDQAMLGADLDTNGGVTLALRAFAKRADDVVLVAPVEEQPFSRRDFTVGSSRAEGIAAEATFSSARLGLTTKYSWQHVRYEYGSAAYTPDHAATHLLDAGAIYFLTPSMSLRVGATAATGRRTTSLNGALEWEDCNLLDQGCEFGGSPGQNSQALGEARVPAYLRVDAGARKHWHIRIGDRTAMVAVFASVTNVLARKNVLTWAPDISTGALTPVQMRPFAPLAVGLDWRF